MRHDSEPAQAKKGKADKAGGPQGPGGNAGLGLGVGPQRHNNQRSGQKGLEAAIGLDSQKG